MKDKFRRIGWILLVVLFVVTGLGVGVVGFWQYTHQKDDSPQSQAAMKCTTNTSIKEVQAVEGQKLEGTKMAGFTPVSKVDTLKCTDIKVGTGTAVQSTSTLVANYTGAVAATGTIFQSSLDSGQPFTSPLSNLIPGWQTGLLGMKAGGVRQLLIPAANAYGATPPQGSGIPANADLVFEISLISVQ
jgi:peptidylprolyl isomerase